MLLRLTCSVRQAPMADLVALLARGPWMWKTRRWPCVHYETTTLTRDEVVNVYTAISREWKRLPFSTLGEQPKRRKALALLKAEGLIEFAGLPKRWCVFTRV